MDPANHLHGRCLVFIYFFVKNVEVVRTEPAEVTAVPFVLYLEISQPGPDGVSTVASTKMVARSASGTTAYLDVAAGRWDRKVVYLDGRSLSLMNAYRSKNRWPEEPAEEAAALKGRLSRPSADCESPGTGKLLRVEEIEREQVGVLALTAAENRFKQWLAPRLGCEVLAFTDEQRQSDGTYLLKAKGKALSLVFGETDFRYFETGDDFREWNEANKLPSVRN